MRHVLHLKVTVLKERRQLDNSHEHTDSHANTPVYHTDSQRGRCWALFHLNQRSARAESCARCAHATVYARSCCCSHMHLRRRRGGGLTEMWNNGGELPIMLWKQAQIAFKLSDEKKENDPTDCQTEGRVRRRGGDPDRLIKTRI